MPTENDTAGPAVLVDEAELDVFLAEQPVDDTGPRRVIDSNSAVNNALRLIRQKTGTGDTAAVPSARARQALDMLATAGDLDGLKAMRPNMPELFANIVDWSGVVRSTKPVIKALGRALLANDAHGNSRYAHGVEIVSFAGAIAKFYEPDHLAAIINDISELNTESAFAPERYLGELFDAVSWAHEHVLRFYKPVIQRRIWVSLWSQAHSMRWWDGIEDNAVRRRGARRRGVDAEATTVPRLVAGAIEPSMDALDMIADLVPNRDELRYFHQLASMMEPNANAQVLASHIAALPPTYRPRTPVVALAQTLTNAWKRYEENVDTPIKEVLPRDPQDFSELCSADGHIPYPIDPRVVRLFHRRMLTIAGREVEMRVMRTPRELKVNGDRRNMANCTFSRNSVCQEGKGLIGHLYWADTQYNFDIRIGDELTLYELNSKANGGVRHPEVKVALDALIAEANRHAR